MKQVYSTDFFDSLKFGKHTCFKFEAYQAEKFEKFIIWRKKEDKNSPLILTVKKNKAIFSWVHLKDDVFFNRSAKEKIVEFIEKVLEQKRVLV